MAKKSFKAGTMLAPLPLTLVSCGDGVKNNILTVAWTGILSTIPPKAYVSIRPSRHSYEIIKKTGEFVINPVPENLVRAADSCGVFTGAKVDKWSRWHLTAEKSEAVAAPSVAECPISIECKVDKVIPLGSHDMFIADIVSFSADESLIDGAGKIHFEKAHLTAFSHGEYFALGKKLGYFGFSAKKKK